MVVVIQGRLAFGQWQAQGRRGDEKGGLSLLKLLQLYGLQYVLLIPGCRRLFGNYLGAGTRFKLPETVTHDSFSRDTRSRIKYCMHGAQTVN